MVIKNGKHPLTRTRKVTLVMPESATPSMEQAAERYWKRRRFSLFTGGARTWLGVYRAMVNEALASGAATVLLNIEPENVGTQKHCYQCSKAVFELSPRSRCVQCEYHRSVSNEKENDELRAALDNTMLAAAPAVQGEAVGFVSQDFLEGKWSLDHIAKSDEGQISRTIPVFTKPPQASEQQPDVTQLVEALEEGLRAIGDHHAPGDCYATGPMTGDPFRDLVQCPACSFIAMCDDLLAAHRKQGGSND